MERLPGNVRGLVGGQIDGGSRHIGTLAETPGGNPAEDRFALLGVLELVIFEIPREGAVFDLVRHPHRR